MSNKATSRNEWEAFVRLLSSDRAILDVLLRGARRRYKAELSILDPTPAERAEAWRQAAREVVVEAFADKGVVRLLTRKMQLCKEESQRASTRRANSRKKPRSASKVAANKASKADTAGTAVEVPSSLAVNTTTSHASTRKVNSAMSRNKIGEERLLSSSARPPEEKNARVLPFYPDADGDGAQQRSLARGCDEPSTRTFAMNPTAKCAAPVPLGLEGGGRQDVDRMAVVEDAGGGCLEHQNTPVLIRDGANGDDTNGRYAIPDAAEEVNDETGDETKNSSLLQVVGKDRPSSSRAGVGDGVRTRARSDREKGFLCKQPNTSDEGATITVLSLPKEHCPQDFSNRSHHQTAGSCSDPPLPTAEWPGAKTAGTGATAPSSSLGVERDQSIARSEAPTAAAAPSPTGVLVENHRASADDGELGSLLSTFERQVERGAELAQRFEQAAKPRLALDDDVKAGGGDHGMAESGNMDMSTMTPSSIDSEEKHFAGSPNTATNIARTTAETKQSVSEPARVGVTSDEAGMGGDLEPERTEKNIAEARLYLSGETERPSPVRGDSTDRSLSAPGEQQHPSPDTNTSSSEDYEFAFDDEEMIVGGHKSVQFTDESRWSTHEVRACFEQHELGDLFYTTAELDSMLEEAESEEASERSNTLLDDTAAGGGGSGTLLSVGGDQVPTRRTGSGTEEAVSFEKLPFDDEDSDYDF